MYLAFIDESGTIHSKNPQNNYYVLPAVIMQEKGMKFLHRETQELKIRIWQLVQGKKKKMPPHFELHMQEIKDAKGFFKPLRGKKDKTEEVIRSIYEFISRLYITIISIVIIKDKFIQKYSEDEFLKWALRLLMERINNYIWNDSPDQKEYALLIMDTAKTDDNTKREIIAEMMELEDKYKSGNVNRILDTPIFLKSEFHNGIQIVDSVAYLIGRYTSKVLDGGLSTLFDELSDEFITNLAPLFYGSPSSIENKGIKFFPSFKAPSNYWNSFKN